MSEKITVYQIAYCGSSRLTLGSIAEVIALFENELGNLELGDSIKVTPCEMTREQFDNLPEFTGF